MFVGGENKNKNKIVYVIGKFECRPQLELSLIVMSKPPFSPLSQEIRKDKQHFLSNTMRI